VWKPNIHRVWVAIVLVSCSLVLFTARLWARLMLPPSMADVRELAGHAPLVFRGQVLAVIPEPGAWNLYTAKIQVDRWYRGKGPTEETLQFRYGSFASDGHDCIDFRPETYWVVFAREGRGKLELSDDCEGALTISSLLGRDLGTADWVAQMEADFLAGLDDHDSAARLASIQRLGGLKLPSSRDALHGVIEKGSDAESKWAVYAALRTGDVSVLPRVKRLLATGDRELPESAIALQLQSLTDPGAVPDLIAILESAPSELTRSRVLIALGEKLKDPRAVPSLAAHLSDPDHYARYASLDGLKNITHEDACTLPRDWKEEDVEPQISRCRLWWEQTGKFRDWSPN
jgi:HEAT repeat protein